MSLRHIARAVRPMMATRTLTTRSALLSMEGTKFSERELALETEYIRRHEAKLRQIKTKTTIDDEKAEILALAAQAKNAHVKEMLQDLADHLHE
eukprot:m.11590 g.11590  ORF g.11590 m.11590 type:complete len:94 (-) comp9850_c0_seq1:79-360(-)